MKLFSRDGNEIVGVLASVVGVMNVDGFRYDENNELTFDSTGEFEFLDSFGMDPVEDLTNDDTNRVFVDSLGNEVLEKDLVVEGND